MARDDLAPGRRRALVLVIVAAGLIPRLHHLGWGLPDFVFLDSRFYYLKPAYRLVWEGVWAPNALVQTPLLGWLIAALYLPWATFVEVEPPGFAHSAASLDWLGRLLTVTSAVASIPLVYLIARRLLGTRTALFAAVAFAFTPFPALEAHRTNSDLPMVFVALLAVHQAIRARDDRSTVRLLASFALAGLAGATKLPGLAVGAVPAWLLLTSRDRSRAERTRLLVGGGVLALVVLAVVVLPVLAGGEGRGVTIGGGVQGGFLRGRRGEDLGGVGWWYVRYLYWLVAGLPYLMGWTVYLAGLVGLVLLGLRRQPAFGVLAAAVVPFFVVQGAAESVTTRYCLLLVPWFAIGCGYALDRACAHRRVAGRLAAVIVLGYAILLTGSQCGRIGSVSQDQVRAALDELVAARGAPITVAYPWLGWLRWDPVGAALRGSAVRWVGLPDRYAMAGPSREETARRYRTWLDEHGIDAILSPAQEELLHTREGFAGPQGAFFEALLAGRLGFEQIGLYRRPFFTEGLYLWADPALDHQLPVGVNGYRLFVRAPASESGARAPTSLSSTVRPSGSVAYTDVPSPVAP